MDAVSPAGSQARRQRSEMQTTRRCDHESLVAPPAGRWPDHLRVGCLRCTASSTTGWPVAA